MSALETTEQALAYLAQFSPGETYRLHPFESGWVCRHVPREPLTRSQTVGQASIILDKETGVITTQSSLPIDLVAENYVEAKRSGRRPPGRQIYPHQWRIDLTQTAQDATTVEYRMTVTSLTEPPEPTRTHPLTLEKDTYLHEPTDSMSAIASSHLHHTKDSRGTWPETATTQV